MRGTILHFDETTGDGFITSDTGDRYTFSRTDISSATPAYNGMAVDFIAEGNAATQIFALPQQPQAPVAAVEVEPELSLWDYAKRVVTRDYAKFSGRARRKEYWGFVLFTCLSYFGLAILTGIGAAMSKNLNADNPQFSPVFWLFVAALVIFAFGIILPSIAVTVRRLHDIGQSGWMYLLLMVLGLIPVVGFITTIVLLVMTCLDGQPGVNKYGPPVKRARVYAPH